MRHIQVLLTFAASLVLFANADSTRATRSKPIEDSIHAAISSATRSEEHKARDRYRKPSEMIAFSGIQAGDTIVEIAPASGYYTALLARVTGPTGRVIGVGPERIFERFPTARNGFSDFIGRDPLENVTYSTSHLDKVDLPNDVDQIWMVLYYHDTYWTGEDRAKMNRRFFDALRPGGVYFVIDHTGTPSASEDITQTLHRLVPEPARREIEAAGFVLESESDALFDPDDPQNDSVFEEHRRGQTNRVVWKFVKPKKIGSPG